jgi:glycosyltransferase involved in cell wall biosynthesis
MKLLIVTQVIDTEHPILGFFHRWVLEFASQCEHVHVICLQAGEYDLPDNVTVHSLGKESGQTKLQYLRTFYRLIWSLRHEYDSVFVHMNQLYVLLGALVWRALRKRIGLWYAHGAVSLSLRLAVPLTHHVFTSTKEGLQVATKKRVIVGQGIDTALFKLPTQKSNSKTLRLITVGRIAASKNIETLLQACAQLKKQTIDFHFTIVGVGTIASESQYEQAMKELAHNLGLDDYVTWVGAVNQQSLPGHLQQSDIFIHDGATNSLDKTLLEAVLCGCIVVSSNPAYRTISTSHTPELLFSPKDTAQLVSILQNIHSTPALESKGTQAMQHFVITNYSMQHLISGIVGKYFI